MELNTIFIAALLILIACIVIGGIRGFLKGSLSLVAFLMAGVIVSAINPFITAFLRDNTKLETWIENRVDTMLVSMVGVSTGKENNSTVLKEDVTIKEDVTLSDGTYLPAGTTIPAGMELPEGLDLNEIKEQVNDNLSTAQQSSIIEKLSIPQSIKNSLEENNNSAIYQRLGVSGFTDYLSAFISNICLNIIGYVLTFLVVFFALHVFTILFKVVDYFPVIHGINHFTGAILGIVKGFLVIELLLLLLIPFVGTGFGKNALEQIDGNAIMGFLYHQNVLGKLLMGVIGKLI